MRDELPRSITVPMRTFSNSGVCLSVSSCILFSVRTSELSASFIGGYGDKCYNRNQLCRENQTWHPVRLSVCNLQLNNKQPSDSFNEMNCNCLHLTI